MRTSLSALAVVALLLVAGCSGLGGPGGDGLSEEELPPGVSQQGVENATVLADAHHGALVASGFEHELDTNYTVRSDAGNQSFDTVQYAAAKPNLSAYHMTVKQDIPARDGTVSGAHTEVWGNDSVTLLRLSRDNRTAYRQVPADSPRFDTGQTTYSRTLAAYLQLGNYTIAGTEHRDGTTYVTLNATQIDNQTVPSSFDAQNVSDYSGTVVVDDEGRIHSIDSELGMQMARGDTNVQVTYRLQDTGEDVTVNEPSWTGAALNRTANR